MACFLVPTGEAVVTTVMQKVVEKKEKEAGEGKVKKVGLSWSQRLRLLNRLLWGGAILLAFEHLWHGEIVPWPPFLTAMNNPADIGPMLHEMGTIGVGMAVFVTLVWAAVVIVLELKIRSSAREEIYEKGLVGA